MTDWTTTEGSPFPLGATWVEKDSAWNFALYSKDAESVTLLLYAEADLVNPVFSLPLRLPPQQIRKDLALPDTPDPPPRRSLLRLFRGRPASRKAASPGTASTRTRSFSIPTRSRSSSPRLSTAQPPRVPAQTPARHPWACSPAASRSTGARTGGPASGRTPFIYELHVRGFTNNPNSGVSPERRGTYAGLVEKIPYLKDLGVTAVELMPVFQFDPQEGNCWGYMPLNFFAPHHGYGSRPEMRPAQRIPRHGQGAPRRRTSRSSSTWSTTTRPKATSAGRFTASRASTTAPTTCCPADPETRTRTSPGPATRCTAPSPPSAS